MEKSYQNRFQTVECISFKKKLTRKLHLVTSVINHQYAFSLTYFCLHLLSVRICYIFNLNNNNYKIYYVQLNFCYEIATATLTQINVCTILLSQPNLQVHPCTAFNQNRLYVRSILNIQVFLTVFIYYIFHLPNCLKKKPNRLICQNSHILYIIHQSRDAAIRYIEYNIILLFFTRRACPCGT